MRKQSRRIFFFIFLSLFRTVLTYAQTANFTADATSGCTPLVVNFQDLSTGNPTSWFWDFGNGATSTLQTPSTTYFSPGSYTIKLTVSNAQGSNTLTRPLYITIYGKPAVNFTVSDSVACFPHRAQFTDLSSPSSGTTNDNWLWDFGNGTQSAQKNPLNIYTTSGTYTVTLKVTNDKGCFNVLSKTGYIKVTGGVIAGFSNTQPIVCRPPYNINFTNNGTGPGTLSYFWDFGDGNTTNQVNPFHQYTKPGNYTVSYVITSSNGCTDTLRKTSLLNIQNIITSLSAPDSICVNSSVYFQNASTPLPAATHWIFGDGTTADSLNPIKIYPSVATYTVSLINTYSYCRDSATKKIKVLPRPVANFTADNTIKCQPSLLVNFQDQSTNAVSWFWSFGDGSTSNQQNPSHTYTGYGKFDVRLIVTNSSGCTDTLTKKQFIKIARPVITIPTLPVRGCIPYTVNPVAVINSLDAVTSYSWNFGDGSAPSAAISPNHVYTTQGTYTITLTITTSTGCTETVSIGNAVKVGTKPIVGFTAVPNPVCALTTVQFTDTSVFNPSTGDKEWIWFFGDGLADLTQNPVHAYSDTGLFNVTLVAINNGCPDSLTKKNYIRVKPPIAKFGFIPDCNTRPFFQFKDSSIYDPSLPTSWLWDFGDGTPPSTLQNPSHTFLTYKPYNVTLTITNGTCANQVTKTVSVIKEKPDFITADTSFCRTKSINFYSSTNNPVNLVDYYWDFGNGSPPISGFNPSIGQYYPNSGYFTVTLITRDIYGCKDTLIKPRYIHVKGPTADFSSPNQSGCKGLTVMFNDLSQPDSISPITNWKWYFGDGTVQSYAGNGSFQHQYVNPGTFNLKLVVSDAGGCKDSLTRSDYVITTSPTTSFSSADTLTCPGSTVHFTNTSNASSYSSEWDLGNGVTSNATSPMNVYTTTGVYPIKLKIRDAYGCYDSLTQSKYIKVSKPVASYTVNDSVSSCTPFEVRFTNTSQYYVSSHWDLGGGISTLTNPIQYYTTPGIYPTKLIITSPGGCTDSATKNIRVFDTAGSKVTYLPLNGCKPLSVDLNAYSPGPASYTWDFGDGVLITNDTTSMNHIYNFFGKFVPKVILTDPSGCIIPVTGLDTIRIKGATARFGLDKRLFCDSGIVHFIDSTTFNDPLTMYNWNFGDGNTSNLQTPVHQYSSPGLYTVYLNVLTQNTCVDTFVIRNAVKVVQSPLISIGGDSVICVFDFMHHTGVFDRSDTSAVQWAWQFPNGNSSNLQNPTDQQYKVPGNFAVSTIATNSSGCKDSATRAILVNPLPTVSLPSVITMQVGYPVNIPVTYSSGVVSYSWTPDTGLSCADCPEPISGPKFNTKYTVTIVDSNGCRNTGNVQIITICKNANVFVPNTFSPNGDGVNDVFYVRGRGLDRVKSLRIFNRWGEVVFEQNNFPVNDPAYGWNGKYRSNKPQADVYIYQLEVFCENSQIIRFEGNIALIQ